MAGKKSIRANAGLSVLKTIAQIIFPLITFPYVSRVLHVENLGIYNFCVSIISYFSLAAGLGINTYAIREGARYRSDREKISDFASEVFTINIFSTILSYLILAVCIISFPKLKLYAPILITLSIGIIFATLGCEWIFEIYEDYTYISIRSIIFQFVSLILLFVFVRDKDDLLIYAAVSVISSSGANIINAVARRKYVKIRLVLNKHVLTNLAPILFLFANSVATTIYTSSDVTMLGILADNRATGLYSVSSNIYGIVKSMISALIIVSIPRLSAYLGQKRIDEFNCTANKILSALIIIVIPSMIGIFALAKNIILIISGKEYADAALSLKILSIALVFSIFGWFYTSCILIPYRREKLVLAATIIAAAVNIILNFILIPSFHQNAAAFTTVAAELISMVVCYWNGRKYFHYKAPVRDLVSVVFGCVGIIVICSVCTHLIDSVIVSTILSIVLSVLEYAAVLKIMKNSSLDYILSLTKKKNKK